MYRLLSAASHRSITAFQVKMNLSLMRHRNAATSHFLAVGCSAATQHNYGVVWTDLYDGFYNNALPNLLTMRNIAWLNTIPYWWLLMICFVPFSSAIVKKHRCIQIWSLWCFSFYVIWHCAYTNDGLLHFFIAFIIMYMYCTIIFFSVFVRDMIL